MTIILIEQDSERIAEFADRVIVLRDGVVTLAGTPAWVFAQIGQMSEIGLSVPQVTEIASCLKDHLGNPYYFIRFDEAYAALKQQLESPV